MNQSATKKLKAPFYKDALQFGESNLGLPYSPFSISNESGHESESPVHEWVSSRLIHELPASASTLVHLDDPMSECVANWIKESLDEVDTISITGIERSSLTGITDSGSFVLIAHHDPGLRVLPVRPLRSGNSAVLTDTMLFASPFHPRVEFTNDAETTYGRHLVDVNTVGRSFLSFQSGRDFSTTRWSHLA